MGLFIHDEGGEVLHAYGYDQLLNWMLLKGLRTFKHTSICSTCMKMYIEMIAGRAGA